MRRDFQRIKRKGKKLEIEKKIEKITRIISSYVHTPYVASPIASCEKENQLFLVRFSFQEYSS